MLSTASRKPNPNPSMCRPVSLLSSSVLFSSLELSDTQVYEPQIRALLRTASHFCEVVVLKLRTVPGWCPRWGNRQSRRRSCRPSSRSSSRDASRGNCLSLLHVLRSSALYTFSALFTFWVTPLALFTFGPQPFPSRFR